VLLTNEVYAEFKYDLAAPASLLPAPKPAPDKMLEPT
jgi:hypothetical protein